MRGAAARLRTRALQVQTLNACLTITAAKRAELSSRAAEAEFPMAITDLPVVSMLKARLHWHQARQKVLAENVANANTPGFKPSELTAPATRNFPGVGSGLQLERTSPLHVASSGSAPALQNAKATRFETRPSGNAVNLEDEMLKVASNQSEYQLAASLYQKSLAMLKTAVGGRA